jgi:hypothetical protein
MKKFLVAAGLEVAGWFVSFSILHSSPPPYTSKRINKAVELLAAGQPIYYAQIPAPATDAHAKGKEMASTYADYITYEMEHGAFSIANLREFMRGLVDAGPTKSGRPSLGCRPAAEAGQHQAHEAARGLPRSRIINAVAGIRVGTIEPLPNIQQ